MTIVAEGENISEQTKTTCKSISTEQIILQAELELTKQELHCHQETKQYQRTHYSVSTLTSEVIRMETGLPTKEVFTIVVEYADNGPIYTRDGSSVWDELGQRTVVRLIIRLYKYGLSDGSSVQTNYHGSSS